MTLEVVEFDTAHVQELIDAQCSPGLSEWMAHNGNVLETVEHAISVLRNGEVLFCLGVIHVWGSYGSAWLFMSNKGRDCVFDIFRIGKKFLKETVPFKRIEATTNFSNDMHNRFIKLAGFKVEAPLLRNYFPDGGDAVLYAMIKD